MQPRANGSNRTTDDLADLLVAEVLDVGEQHDLALFRGQVGERFRDRFAEIAVDVLLDWLNRERAAAAEC